VGTCLLGKCQKELARCVADEKCIESLVCLNTCSGRPDESDCQIKCGDLYNDAAVGAFNTCAVTEQKCVPQKQDDSTFPALDKARTVPNLATSNLEGRWYIVAGLNPLFDTFDCQVHYFSAPKEGELYGKINWRVRRPNGDFYDRSDIQTFVADPQAPAVLYNHDNEFLHYEDDWYIVDSNDDYFVVYYRGQNDAWVGYGGAVVYAREPSLRPEWVPRLREVVKTKLSNIDGATRSIRWEDFKITDNTCAPRPTIPRIVAPSDLDTLGADVVALEKDFVGDVVAIEREVGRDVVAIEREIVKDVRSVEDGLVSFGSRFTLLNNKSVVGADSASPQQKQQDVPASVRRSLNKVEARYESSIEGAEGGGLTRAEADRECEVDVADNGREVDAGHALVEVAEAWRVPVLGVIARIPHHQLKNRMPHDGGRLDPQ